MHVVLFMSSTLIVLPQNTGYCMLQHSCHVVIDSENKKTDKKSLPHKRRTSAVLDSSPHSLSARS